MTILLSNEVINELNAFAVECGEKYKDLYLNKSGKFIHEEDKVEFEKLQNMTVFNWDTEEAGQVLDWYFEENQDLEIEIRKFLIKTFEKIKHDSDYEIPFECKQFALDAILEAFDAYVSTYGIDYYDFEILERNIEFTLTSIAAVFRAATYRNRKDFEDYLTISKQKRKETLEIQGAANDDEEEKAA